MKEKLQSLKSLILFREGTDWVQVADYYAIWDSKTIDPYNLNPLEFEQISHFGCMIPAKVVFGTYLPVK